MLLTKPVHRRHRGVTRARINKLIYLRGVFTGYTVETSGFAGQPPFEVISVAEGNMIVRKLRALALVAPWKFPANVLTLSELAQIAYYETKAKPPVSRAA